MEPPSAAWHRAGSLIFWNSDALHNCCASSRGLFRVHGSASRPEHAFLEVQYRGYWFYIDDTDLESKSSYTLLAQLFSLQSASGSMQGPVLTIPAR